MGGRAAHARPHRRHRSVQEHHHQDRQRHADPRLGHRLRRGHDAEGQASALFIGDGSPAIQLDIRRASGENTIKVTEAVKQKLRPVQQTLPKGVDARDHQRRLASSSTRRSSRSKSTCCGAACSRRWSSCSSSGTSAPCSSRRWRFPASIIATFTLMRVMDFTLNNMTLLGLTLAVGIVIDDAIVVLENIFRYIEEKHCTPFEAAIQGTREVALPVMATTLSLVVIFLPVAFMTGYARALHLSVRLDDGVRDSGLDARELHADADAQLALPEGAGRRRRQQDQGEPLLPRRRPLVRGVAELVARASDGDSRHVGARGRC